MPTLTIEDVRLEEAIDIARGHLYAFLASAFADPAGPHFDLALDSKLQTVASAAADLLASEGPNEMRLGPGERSPAQLSLAPVVEQLRMPRQYLVGEHQRVFGLLIGKTAPLNETEYCRSTDAFYRAQELADIAGFYRAFGLERDVREPERPDHLSVELEFMARLIEKELFAAKSSNRFLRHKAPLCRDGQRKFFQAHLLWWLPGFTELLPQGAVTGLYVVLAEALASFLPAERLCFGLAPAGVLAGFNCDVKPTTERKGPRRSAWHL